MITNISISKSGLPYLAYMGFIGFMAGMVAASACNQVQGIDVCDRDRPKENIINVRNEGNQRIHGSSAIAALAGGGAFVVFTSDVSGAAGEENTEIRGTLLDPEGQRIPTCDEKQEVTYAEPDESGPDEQKRAMASVAMPKKGDEPGFITYVSVNDKNWQVMGRPITNSGCIYSSRQPIQISEEEPNTIINLPVAVALGDKKFVVLWVSVMTGVDSRLRARALKVGWKTTFLPVNHPGTGVPTDGEPVDFRPSGEFISSVAAIPVRDDQFAVTWTKIKIGMNDRRYVTYFAMYDDRLNQLFEPVVVYSGKPTDTRPIEEQAGIAYDGSQFIIVWQERDELGITRVYGRFVDEKGQFLRSSVTPDGYAFRVATSNMGEEGWVSTAKLYKGGFLVAWIDKGSSEAQDQSDSTVRASAFDAYRNRQFVNFACDRTDFQLIRSAPGGQDRISLVTMSNGSVAAAWTDFGTNDVIGRESSFIRAMAVDPRDLLPID